MLRLRHLARKGSIMKRSIIVTVAILIVAAAIVGLIVAKAAKRTSSSSPTPPPKTSPSPTAASSPSQVTSASPSPTQNASPQAPTGSSITITNFAFSPATVTVKKGTAVTWTNQDSVGHTVSETDSQTGPSSSLLAQGKSFVFTFASTGTFHYHCSVHPNMTGTIIVTN